MRSMIPTSRPLSRHSGGSGSSWAGLLTEVCVVYPALNATDEGYEIQVVADASGSATKMADDIALDRMRQAGVAITSTVQIMSEIVSNWAEGAGPKVMPVLVDLYAELG